MEWSDFELKVIDTVRVFYETDRVRQIKWELEAEKFPDMTSIELKKAWVTIRDKYRRRLKKCPPDLLSTYRGDELNFLHKSRPKVVAAETESSGSQTGDILKNYLTSMQKECNDVMVCETQQEIEDNTTIPDESHRNTTPDELRINTSPIEYNSILNIDYNENNVHAFFEKLSEYVIKRYPPEKYQEIKTEICSIVANEKC